MNQWGVSGHQKFVQDRSVARYAGAVQTALVADPLCETHDPGLGHPEQPGRFTAVLEGLNRAGLMAQLQRLDARDAKLGELELVHARNYLRLAEEEIHRGFAQLTTGDTSISPESWDAALRSAGGALVAVDAVCSGKAPRAFVVARPPGHHAGATYGMGFCVVNNIAIAARYAQKAHGMGKILIVDWDVHHGNGTQDIFYEDDSVFFCSTHQSPWYPGTGDAAETGKGRGLGTTLNFPLPAGSGRSSVLGALETRLASAMEKFRPEFVLVSAGFDSRIDDPLGQFRLTDEDFADLTRLVRQMADVNAEGRIVSLLEGGYSLSGLASAAAAHVKELL
jgi:acetoin utilization deacetylase AcuC-like enzyme